MFRHLLLVFLFTTALSAQNVNPDRNTVVATSGLLLRAAPYAGADILAGVPFGERVAVIDPCDYGHTTIGTIPDYYRYEEHPGLLAYEAQEIAGKWVKVKYDRDTGYVFDAYLSTTISTPTVLDDDANEITPEIVLLEPGVDVSQYAYHPTDYHYYGVYQIGPDRMALRKVRLDYFVAGDGDFGGVLAAASPARDLLYIVGSKTKLRPHTFSGKHFTAHSLIYSGYAGADGPKITEVPGLQVELPGVDTYAEGPTIHVRTPSGPVMLQPENAYAEEVYVTGTGDVDGDGVGDYVLLYASEKHLRSVLFLSSLQWRSAALAYPLGC